jgi:hypothetical protein
MVRGQTKQVVPEAPSPKYSKAKWTGGVAQAVKGLLCKCEALSLNPSPTKKKKKKAAEIRRIKVRGQSRQEISKTPSLSISQTWWRTCVYPRNEEGCG